MDQSNELPPGGALPGRGAAPAAPAGAVHAAADAVHAAADAAPAAVAGEGHGHRGVALLLGTAAILAAIVGARASALSSDAGDAWQSALRTEVKRSASAIEDIRYLYQSELPIAIRILQSRLLVAELQSAAAAGGSTAQALTFEVGVQSGLLTAIEPSSDLATGALYALPSGGLDLGKRLADLTGKAARHRGPRPRRRVGDGGSPRVARPAFDPGGDAGQHRRAPGRPCPTAHPSPPAAPGAGVAGAGGRSRRGCRRGAPRVSRRARTRSSGEVGA